MQISIHIFKKCVYCNNYVNYQYADKNNRLFNNFKELSNCINILSYTISDLWVMNNDCIRFFRYHARACIQRVTSARARACSHNPTVVGSIALLGDMAGRHRAYTYRRNTFVLSPIQLSRHVSVTFPRLTTCCASVRGAQVSQEPGPSG